LPPESMCEFKDTSWAGTRNRMGPLASTGWCPSARVTRRWLHSITTS
jgi:hypothetical protein